MSDSKLKPCPFCGGEATLWQDLTADRQFHILCGCGGRVGWFETKEEAIRAWNTRTQQKEEGKKEYIERGALIAEYDRVHVGAPGGARRLMVDAPAADVVEVVRCKDCKHYKQNPWNKETDMLCQCYSDWRTTEPNDFCGYGERKEQK